MLNITISHVYEKSLKTFCKEVHTSAISTGVEIICQTLS